MMLRKLKCMTSLACFPFHTYCLTQRYWNFTIAVPAKEKLLSKKMIRQMAYELDQDARRPEERATNQMLSTPVYGTEVRISKYHNENSAKTQCIRQTSTNGSAARSLCVGNNIHDSEFQKSQFSITMIVHDFLWRNA
jgi:hypothetical protein